MFFSIIMFLMSYFCLGSKDFQIVVGPWFILSFLFVSFFNVGSKSLNSFICTWLYNCPSNICLKDYLSSLNCFGIFTENQLTLNIKVYFWTQFCSITLKSVFDLITVAYSNWKMNALPPFSLQNCFVWTLGSICQFPHKHLLGFW